MTNTRSSTSLFMVVLMACLMTPLAAGAPLDTSKYIGIDEIKPDMEAYCLTVFAGSEVEKFNLKILSVVRGANPGRDMILVIGTDERFNHSSAIHGCSGSSVFIDGRLAGALAAGWDGSLDSLYLVRPIEDMLEVGESQASPAASDRYVAAFDFSEPLNLETYYSQMIEQVKSQEHGSRMYLPLSSSIPPQTFAEDQEVFEAMGLIHSGTWLPNSAFDEVGEFERGGVLSLVLCSGDISMAATGTVTEVEGDQVYGFGHSFQGSGPANLPMATGIVHTVVASRKSSFKLSTPGPIAGAIQFDQGSGIRGTIGAMPETIPLHIKVQRFNDVQEREYNCDLAVDEMFTPMILQSVLRAAVTVKGNLPKEHLIRYAGQVKLVDGELINIDNISSGKGTMDVTRDFFSVASLLMGNPFERIKIASIDVQIQVEPEDIAASIWSVDLDRTTLYPGQTISAQVSLQPYRRRNETVSIDLKIPDDLAPGKYKIKFMGGRDYQGFESSTAPQRFRAVDAASLKKALAKLLSQRSDRLYAVMPTPASGLVIRHQELGQLPPTKMLLMQDSKRVQPLEPYKSWVQNHTVVDRIISGTADIEITVKRRK